MSNLRPLPPEVNRDDFPTDLFLYAVANGIYPDEPPACLLSDEYDPSPDDEAWYVSQFYRSLDMPSDDDPDKLSPPSWVDRYRGLIPRDLAEAIAARGLVGHGD